MLRLVLSKAVCVGVDSSVSRGTASARLCQGQVVFARVVPKVSLRCLIEYLVKLSLCGMFETPRYRTFSSRWPYEPRLKTLRLSDDNSICACKNTTLSSSRMDFLL